MLVGREEELRRVGDLLASDGAVVLAGPAGIGKTSLARAVLGRLGPHREGGGLASLAWSPLLVFRRLLRDDPAEAPDEVAHAVLRGGTAPLLLDDLQWCDDASLDVVVDLVGRVPLVATVRTGEDRSDHVVAALGLLGIRVVELGGLSATAASSLVDRLHPDLGDAARADLLTVADGHPLLLTELPRGVDAAPGLVSALVGRLERLSDDARRALDRLVVLGRPAEVDLLGPGAPELVDAGLATSPEPGWLEVRHGLLGEVLVEELGPAADDVRRALAGAVGPAEGAHLLAVAGDREAARALALEAAGHGGRRRRAELLRLAVTCAPDLDVDRRVAAARLFTETSQPAAARELCAVAERDDLPPLARGALLAAEAEAAWMQGDQRGCAELVTRAIADLQGTDTEIEVLALAGSTIVNTFVDLDGRPALERARAAVALADRIGAAQGYARSRLAAVLVTAGEPGWSEAYREVLVHADAAGDRDLHRTAFVGLLLGHWLTGDLATAEALAREELAARPRQGFDVPWLTVASYAAILGVTAGRPRDELLATYLPLLEQEPHFRSRPFLEAAVVLALADDGRHAEAAALSAGADDRVGREAQWRAIAGWASVEAAWLGGRPDDALQVVERLGSLAIDGYPAAVMARLVGAHAAIDRGAPVLGGAPSIVLPAWQTAPIEWEGLVHRAAGRHDAAADVLLEAATGWAPCDPRSEVRCRWAAGDGLVAVDRDRAVAVLSDAERRAEEVGLRALSERIRRSLRSAGVARRAASTDGRAGLTGREEQVLVLVGEGLTTGGVATRLGIESSTVESLVRSAMRKLGVRTRAAAVARLAPVSRGGSPPTG